MDYKWSTSQKERDLFKARIKTTDVFVEYINQPFVDNPECLSSYKYNSYSECAHVMSFKVSDYLLQINLVLEQNSITILPIVRMAGNDFFDANFYSDGTYENTLMRLFIQRISEEFLDKMSKLLLGLPSNQETLMMCVGIFKNILREKQSLGQFQYRFYLPPDGRYVLVDNYNI